jgi:hypothetical protein
MPSNGIKGDCRLKAATSLRLPFIRMKLSRYGSQRRNRRKAGRMRLDRNWGRLPVLAGDSFQVAAAGLADIHAIPCAI